METRLISDITLHSLNVGMYSHGCAADFRTVFNGVQAIRMGSYVARDPL